MTVTCTSRLQSIYCSEAGKSTCQHEISSGLRRRKLNPDQMPKRWWPDEDYWEIYDIYEEIYRQMGDKKEDKNLEDVLKEDWMHTFDYEDWLKAKNRKSTGAAQAGRSWTSRRFKEGQLVQAAFGHPFYSEKRGLIGLIIEEGMPRHGRPTSPLTVKVLWPDDTVETVSEDNLQACKPDPKGL